jgi:hypothetical protein
MSTTYLTWHARAGMDNPEQDADLLDTDRKVKRANDASGGWDFGARKWDG